MAADVWGEVRGWRCTWLDWREERAWLGRAIWSEALLGSCWEAKEPAGSRRVKVADGC